MQRRDPYNNDPTHAPYSTDWNRIMGQYPGTTVATPKITKSDPFALGESNLRSMASDIGAEENRRYQAGLEPAQSAYQSLLAVPPVDAGLMFSRAADAIGARAGSSLNALRQSFGARGLNPNSGAGQGALERLLMQQTGEVLGAEGQTALEAQKLRQTQAASNFAAALNLGQAINAPVSQIGLDTEQNIFEGMLAKYGIDKQRKSAKESNKNNILGGLIGGVGSVLGGLL